MIRWQEKISILLLGYLYCHYVVEYYSLVSIGMISFAAVVQLCPAVIGGMEGGNLRTAGRFFIWGYILVLPSLSLAVEPGPAHRRK